MITIWPLMASWPAAAAAAAAAACLKFRAAKVHFYRDGSLARSPLRCLRSYCSVLTLSRIMRASEPEKSATVPE